MVLGLRKVGNPICGIMMNLKLDLPEDLFDAQFPEDDFAARVRELAILELVRVKRFMNMRPSRCLGSSDGNWSRR